MTEVWHGLEQLRPLLVPLKDLREQPNNARGHSERNLSVIAASLKDFGQHRLAVYVEREGKKIVIVGSGMLRAMRDSGWTHCAAAKADDDDVTAQRRAITDNRSGDYEVGSIWDFTELADQLAEADTGGVDLNELGWGPEDLQGIAEWTPPGGLQGMTRRPADPDRSDVVCPECGTEFTPE